MQIRLIITEGRERDAETTFIHISKPLSRSWQLELEILCECVELMKMQ